MVEGFSVRLRFSGFVLCCAVEAKLLRSFHGVVSDVHEDSKTWETRGFGTSGTAGFPFKGGYTYKLMFKS